MISSFFYLKALLRINVKFARLCSSSNISKTITIPSNLLTESKDTDLRLSKILANTGICSRREGERWISNGRVKINDSICTSSVRIIEPTDKVYLDDNLLTHRKAKASSSSNLMEAPKLWAVYKIIGELVAHHDGHNRPCLFERLHNLEHPKNLYKIQYLGFNTEVIPSIYILIRTFYTLYIYQLHHTISHTHM